MASRKNARDIDEADFLAIKKHFLRAMTSYDLIVTM